MNDAEIYQKLVPIFRDVFDDDDLALRPDMTADDVAEWDSMSHIRLVLTIERQFKLAFPASRISQLKNVGDLVALIKTTA